MKRRIVVSAVALAKLFVSGEMDRKTLQAEGALIAFLPGPEVTLESIKENYSISAEEAQKVLDDIWNATLDASQDDTDRLLGGGIMEKDYVYFLNKLLQTHGLPRLSIHPNDPYTMKQVKDELMRRVDLEVI